MSEQALLGEVVTWDIRSPEVPFEIVRKALLESDLPEEEAHELTTRSAWTRACRSLKEDRSIDKIDSKGDKLRFQFTRKFLKDSRFDFDYELTVCLDTETGSITCDENPDFAIVAESLLAGAMEVRNASDITRMVQRLFEKHADLFPINPRKGVAYFVPNKHKDFTSKVETFLSHLNGSLCRFPVPAGTTEGNLSVRDAVANGLSSLLGELNASVEDWDGTTREKTMLKASERFKQIQYKVDAYAEYLSSSQDALKDALQEAKKAMLAKIDEISAVEAA